MSVDKFNAKAKLKKFKKQFILGGGLVFVLILVMVYSTDTKDTPPPEKIQSSQVYTAVKKLNPSTADVLLQQNEQQQLQQAQINQQLLQKINDLESQNQTYRKAALEQESNTNALNDKLGKLNTTKIAASGATGNYVSQKPVKAVFEDDINNDSGDDSTFESATQRIGQTANNSSSDKPDEIKSISTYIPSNTFVKGTLIVALSANTGGNADTTPTPFLVRLTDLARLPNEFRANLRSCMVAGSGYGDLSTERIKMRTTKMSCVLKNGQAIDIQVDGYIAGEDSKPGMRGMVVTHSGGVAAKATLAGFIQGIGAIGQAMGQTQTITPLGGVTTTISPQQAVTAGAGAGISQAGQTLSQYYMNMLTQISPSIEVSAGRHVTVVFTNGVELKLPINSQDVSNNSPLPIQ
jgi:hypothetical protein